MLRECSDINTVLCKALAVSPKCAWEHVPTLPRRISTSAGLVSEGLPVPLWALWKASLWWMFLASHWFLQTHRARVRGWF